jgi:hypothetical protein
MSPSTSVLREICHCYGIATYVLLVLRTAFQKRTWSPARNRSVAESFIAAGAGNRETVRMRSVLLWLIGIPIPIILLIALCTHHF